MIARLKMLLELMKHEPCKAADELERLADNLKMLAKKVRDSNSKSGRSPMGMGDRVMVDVLGPDGEIRQSVDTGGKANGG